MARQVSSPIFVGRRAELDRLGVALAEATGGHARAIVIEGEAGVGKTRLVAEFAQRAGAAGARLAHGSCIPVGTTGLPYGPIVEVFRSLRRNLDPGELDEILGPARDELARLVPALATSTGPGAPVGSTPANPGRLFHLVLDSLGRAATAAPLVAIVEDLHWADRASLDLLAFLVHALEDERVLLLMSYRNDELARHHPIRPFLAELERSRRSERLELNRLEPVELRDLIGGILGHEPEPSLVAQIHARSFGNPYYAEELLAVGGATDALPATLREVLLARIDSLSDATQELLRIASAARSRVHPDVLAAVRGGDPDTITAALREAVEHHVLVAMNGDAEMLGFRHALLGEAVYSEILPGERRRLHAAFARALPALARENVDPFLAAELAHHYAAAGEPDRALEASVQAGLAARAASAFGDAELHFEQAVDLWPRVAGASTLVGMDLPGLLELAAEAALTVGTYGRAAAHMRAALALVDERQEPARAGIMCDRLAHLARLVGDVEAARAAQGDALRLIADDPPSPDRARVLAGLARGLMSDGAYVESADTARRAIDIARTFGDRQIEADALATLGAAENRLGSPDVGDPILREARDLAQEIGDLGSVERSWVNIVSNLEGESCVSEALAAADWANAHGRQRTSAWVLAIASLALWELGRWNELEARLERAWAISGEGPDRALVEIARAHLELGRGLDETARGRAARVRALAARHGEVMIDWLLLASHIEIQGLLARGERAAMDLNTDQAREALDAGRRKLDEALAVLDTAAPGRVALSCRILSTALRVEADLATLAHTHGRRRDLEHARLRGAAILERARAFRETLVEHPTTLWRRPTAVVALCEAEWTRLEGHSDPNLWSEAAATCGWAGQHHLRPYALMRHAEAILVDRRHRSAAAPLLRDAHETAATMGAAPLQRLIETLAARARIELEARPEPPDAATLMRERAARLGLTPREQEVLVLIAAGHSNREIGDHLFIGERTAGVHVSNILGKLAVASRTEAAARAYRLGLAGSLEAGETTSGR